MHLSSPSRVQVRTVTRRTTSSGNDDDNNRGRQYNSSIHIITECHIFCLVVALFFCVFVLVVTQTRLNLFVSAYLSIYICIRLVCRLMLAFSTNDDVLSCKWSAKGKQN